MTFDLNGLNFVFFIAGFSIGWLLRTAIERVKK